MNSTSPHEFEIVPGIGALPLKFGMSPEQAEAIVGTPNVRDNSDRLQPGVLKYRYNDFDMSLGFQRVGDCDWYLDSIGFGPRSSVSYEGVRFFDLPMKCLSHMINRSHRTSELCEILDFEDLGISIGDLFDRSEVGIRVFPVVSSP